VGVKKGGNGGSGAGVHCTDANIANCTIAGNVAGMGGRSEGGQDGSGGKGTGLFYSGQMAIIDSIIWDNSPDGLFGHDCNNVSFSNIQDSNCVGINGNISVDPLFVPPSYWDPSGVPGDYHLSQIAAGQAADSPCIETGSETAANLGMDIYTTRTDKVSDQGIVDMGHHYCQNVADLNDDGVVDMKDMAILGSQWQQAPTPPSADIDPLATGDGVIDMHDLAMLAQWWLWPW